MTHARPIADRWIPVRTDGIETGIGIYVYAGFQIVHELESSIRIYVAAGFLVRIHLKTGVEIPNLKPSASAILDVCFQKHEFGSRYLKLLYASFHRKPGSNMNWKLVSKNILTSKPASKNIWTPLSTP